MQDHSRPQPATLRVLIFLLLFLGLNAFGAGGAFILAPDGHLIQMPLSNLKNSPFSDFMVPGVLLFFFLGIYPLFVAYGLWKRPPWKWPDIVNPSKETHWSWAGSLVAGSALIIWITVQVQWLQVAFLHVLCFAWGVLILVLTLVPGVRRYYALRSRLETGGPH